MTPNVGDFGLVSTTGGSLLDKFSKWAIEFGTDSPVDHAFVYVGDGRIVEAVSRVQISPVTDYQNITWSTGRMFPTAPITEMQGQWIANAARSYVGEHYNAIDIVAIALYQRRLGRVLKAHDWIAKRLSDDHMQICSQLVVNAYRAAGVDLMPGIPSGLVSPGDLYTLIDR